MNRLWTWCRSSPEREFGLTTGVIFVSFGLLPLYLHHPLRIWACILSAMLILPALLRPQLLSCPNWLWMKFAHILGWINTRLLLALVFFLVLTPLGLMAKLSGRKIMPLKMDRELKTYRRMVTADLHQSMKNQY